MGWLFGWFIHWFQFCYCYNSTYSLPLGATAQHLCVMELERERERLYVYMCVYKNALECREVLCNKCKELYTNGEL